MYYSECTDGCDVADIITYFNVGNFHLVVNKQMHLAPYTWPRLYTPMFIAINIATANFSIIFSHCFVHEIFLLNVALMTYKLLCI